MATHQNVTTRLATHHDFYIHTWADFAVTPWGLNEGGVGGVGAPEGENFVKYSLI